MIQARTTPANALAAFALAASTSILASCVAARPAARGVPHPTAPISLSSGPLAVGANPTPTRSLILLTLDGVRWQDVCNGVEPARARRAGLADDRIVDAPTLLPNLYRLAARGTLIGAGADRIDASGPNYVSLPGYWEILTGHRPPSCRTNHCSATMESTLIDEVAAAPGVARSDVAVFSSWERIERAAAAEPDKVVLSTGRHGGQPAAAVAWDDTSRALLERAAAVDPWPGDDDYRPDAFTAELAVHYLETRDPRLLYLSLGDTDEHAHHDDYRRYLDALVFADHTLGRILDDLDALGERGRQTAVVVTTDHGRAANFKGHGAGDTESGRVWLAAGGGGIAPAATSETGARWYLGDVAPTLRTLVGLPDDPSEGAGVAIGSLLGHDARIASASDAQRRFSDARVTGR